MCIRDRVNVYEKYKSDSQQSARKQLVRLGENERLILEFSKYHYMIQAAQVRVWLQQNYGIELDLRRIHDSLQRLLRKGIVEKVARGVYRLTEFGKSILGFVKTRKETECTSVDGDANVSSSNVEKRVRVTRVHIYNRKGSVEEFVRQLIYVKKVIDCTIKYVRGLIGSAKFRRIARSVEVSCIDFRIGGHGVYGLKHRPLISLDRLLSLGLKPRELGVDVKVITSLDRLFSKVYIT